MFKAKNILVPMDFSPESELALDWAIMIAKEQSDAYITLCHMSPPMIAPIGPEAVAFNYARAEEAERKAAEKKLKRLQGRIPKPIRSSCTAGIGHIPTEIERICHKKAIDLVVMTTHGRTGLSRFLHGSTTEETARLAPCPVLVLHLNRVTRAAVKETSTV